MLEWILAGLAVYVIYVFTPSVFYVGRVGMLVPLGPRDAPFEPRLHHARALRALSNFRETLPIFLTLGVLALVVPGSDMAQATLGAMIVVLARVIYLPLYILGVAYLRSAVWMVTWVGFALMTLALL